MGHVLRARLQDLNGRAIAERAIPIFGNHIGHAAFDATPLMVFYMDLEGKGHPRLDTVRTTALRQVFEALVDDVVGAVELGDVQADVVEIATRSEIPERLQLLVGRGEQLVGTGAR